LFFCSFLNGSCYAFPDSLNYYKEEVKLIDSSDLTLTVIPWSQLEHKMQSYDHGVEIILYYDSLELKKAEISYGMSRGPRTITVYFRDTIPFYIHEVAKQYHFDLEKGEFDYDKPMTEIERKELYVYDWKNNYCVNLLNSKESETGPIQHPFSPNDYLYSVELVLQFYKPD
jgi:hypothetical protein